MDTKDGSDRGVDDKLLSCFLQRHFQNAIPAKILSIVVEDGAPKGENVCSCVYRVKLRCLLASGRKRTLSMIVKTELKSVAAKENISVFPMFRTEVKMYTTILPLMEDLQEEFGDRRECLWANLYGYERYKLVAIEDLSDQNYMRVNRKDCLDLNHALLVLRGMGRFHAMSKILLSRHLISDEDKGKMLLASREPVAHVWWHVLLSVLSESMVNTWGKEWEGLSKKIAAQEKTIVGKVADVAEVYDKRFEVLNHGDLWTCNFLFKYLDFERLPISLKIIDFQLCHLNSFIWDVEFFINTSVEPKVRRHHKDMLLFAYQESLEKNLKLFNYSGYIPTLEDVKSESQRLEFPSLAILLVSCIMCADTQNAFEMEKLSTHPPNEVIEPSVFTDGKALAALGEDLRRYAAAGII